MNLCCLLHLLHHPLPQLEIQFKHKKAIPFGLFGYLVGEKFIRTKNYQPFQNSKKPQIYILI